MALDPNDPQIRALIEAEIAKRGQVAEKPLPNASEGMQGFGHINKEILKDAAGGMDDALAFGMMSAGGKPVAGGGGLIAEKSPWEAAADGVKNAIGTYGMLSSIKSKRDTAGKLADILSPKAKANALRGAQMFDAEGTPMLADGSMGFETN